MTSRTVVEAAWWAGSASLSSLSDVRLVDLTREGNERAFEAIVARYREPLLRYGSRLLPGGQAHRAEDVVQQALANAHRALLRDRRDVNLRPWLYRITHNQAINALRDRGWEHTELTESIDGVEQPDQVAERHDELTRLFTLVRALPESQRVALVRRELEGESHERIAADLGLSRGAVRQLIFHARMSVRAAVAALLPAPVLSRFPWAGGSVGDAGAGLATGGGGAIGAKLIATLAATGAVTAGAAAVVGTRGENAARPDPAGTPAAQGGEGFDPSRATQERGAGRGRSRQEHHSAGATGERHLGGEGSRGPSGGHSGRDVDRAGAVERADDRTGATERGEDDAAGGGGGDADDATQAPSTEGSGTDDSLTSPSTSADSGGPTAASAGSPAEPGDDGASRDSRPDA